jgi:sugar lactone lactonase YvrE
MARRFASLAVASALLAVHAAQAQNSYPDPYRMVEGFPADAASLALGQVIGVQIDPDGKSIWIFERCGGSDCANSDRAPIIELDASGAVTKRFGAGMFIVPHGFTVDRAGTIWTSDAGGRNGIGQQVIEFDRAGQVLRRLGTAGVQGETETTFRGPTAIAVAEDGALFVADGHGNSRIVKFDQGGHFLKAWGRKGAEPGEFDTPHALAIDRDGRLFVADRGNNRIQIFDEDGHFIAQWRQFGRPSGLYIDRNDTLYVADSDSTDQTNPGFQQGIRIGSASDGTVRAFIPTGGPGRGNSTEGVAADEAGNVFGGETGNGHTVRKYERE